MIHTLKDPNIIHDYGDGENDGFSHEPKFFPRSRFWFAFIPKNSQVNMKLLTVLSLFGLVQSKIYFKEEFDSGNLILLFLHHSLS